MGFRLSSVTVRGKSPEEIHRALALTATGTYEEFPESPWTGAKLSDGWYLVVENGGYFDNPKQLSKLSVNGVVIVCFVHEGIMVSEAAEWRNGKKIWSVLHNIQKGRGHLEVQGALPSAYSEIRQRLEAKQAASEGGVDYIFDIPVELAQSVTGYRHDAPVEVSDPGYEVLFLNPSKPPSLFQKLFGKS